MCKDSTAPRVVVTGLGTINSHGVGIDKLWDGVLSGVSGIRKIQSFDAVSYTHLTLPTIPLV